MQRKILRALFFAGLWLSLVGSAVGRVHQPLCASAEEQESARATHSDHAEMRIAHGSGEPHHRHSDQPIHADHRDAPGHEAAGHGTAPQANHGDPDCDSVCLLTCALSSVQPPLPASAQRAILDAATLCMPSPLTAYIPQASSPPYRPPRPLAL